jgi:DNA-binding protein HU-beta
MIGGAGRLAPFSVQLFGLWSLVVNKQELVQAVASKAGMTRKDVGTVLDALMGTIQETVAGGEEVRLVGFGVFEARSRKVKEGRNPKTGEMVIIPAKTVPAFKAGAEFKKTVGAGRRSPF